MGDKRCSPVWHKGTKLRTIQIKESRVLFYFCCVHTEIKVPGSRKRTYQIGSQQTSTNFGRSHYFHLFFKQILTVFPPTSDLWSLGVRQNWRSDSWYPTWMRRPMVGWLQSWVRFRKPYIIRSSNGESLNMKILYITIVCFLSFWFSLPIFFQVRFPEGNWAQILVSENWPRESPLIILIHCQVSPPQLGLSPGRAMAGGWWLVAGGWWNHLFLSWNHTDTYSDFWGFF